MPSREDILLIGAGAVTVITIISVIVAVTYFPIVAAPVALIGVTIASMLAYDAIKHFFRTLVDRLYKKQPIHEPSQPPPDPLSPESGLHQTHTMLFSRHESDYSDGGTHYTSDAEESLTQEEIIRPKKPRLIMTG
jgi:hypothetical protein